MMHLEKGSQPEMKFFVQNLTTMTDSLKHFRQLIQKNFIAWTKPARSSLVAGAVSDLPKSKPEFIAENALLRKQLIILNRQVKKPSFTFLDRFLLVVLVSKLKNWN